MQPRCFQGKQISYLLQRRAKWDKNSKISSLKSLQGKMPYWGTQATAIKHETFQALPLKLWDYPKVFIEQHTQRCFESGLQYKNSNSCCPARTRLRDSQYSTRSLPTNEEMTFLNFIPAVRTCPHLNAVATWAQKLSSSVTAETNIETLVICSPVFSRKFTYELHTKFLWSDKLFWTCMKQILLLHYHPPLAILCCLYEKPISLKSANIKVNPSLAFQSTHRNGGLEIRTYISRDFRFPDFLPDRATGYSAAVCISVNTVICTGQEIIWCNPVDSQRHKALYIIAYIKDWC